MGASTCRQQGPSIDWKECFRPILISFLLSIRYSMVFVFFYSFIYLFFILKGSSCPRSVSCQRVYLMMYSECSFIVLLFGKKVSCFICSFFFTGRVVDSARMCRDGVVGGVSRRTSLLIRLFYCSFVHSSIPLSKAWTNKLIPKLDLSKRGFLSFLPCFCFFFFSSGLFILFDFVDANGLHFFDSSLVGDVILHLGLFLGNMTAASDFVGDGDL